MAAGKNCKNKIIIFILGLCVLIFLAAFLFWHALKHDRNLSESDENIFKGTDGHPPITIAPTAAYTHVPEIGTASAVVSDGENVTPTAPPGDLPDGSVNATAAATAAPVHIQYTVLNELIYENGRKLRYEYNDNRVTVLNESGHEVLVLEFYENGKLRSKKEYVIISGKSELGYIYEYAETGDITNIYKFGRGPAVNYNYIYDENGALKSAELSYGADGISDFEYDYSGSIKKQTAKYRNGSRSVFLYDSGRIVSEKYYDAMLHNGNLTYEINYIYNDDGFITEMHQSYYDLYGRKIIKNYGEYYNEAGNVCRIVKDNLKGVTENFYYEYDEFNNLFFSVTAVKGEEGVNKDTLRYKLILGDSILEGYISEKILSDAMKDNEIKINFDEAAYAFFKYDEKGTLVEKKYKYNGFLLSFDKNMRLISKLEYDENDQLIEEKRINYNSFSQKQNIYVLYPDGHTKYVLEYFYDERFNQKGWMKLDSEGKVLFKYTNRYMNASVGSDTSVLQSSAEYDANGIMQSFSTYDINGNAVKGIFSSATRDKYNIFMKCNIFDLIPEAW